MKNKVLFILHQSPPFHGAAKVGDFIANSKKLKKNFKCKFIPIRSSKDIKEIGKINLNKLKDAIDLKKQVNQEINNFRPDKIYYTPSMGPIAFLRDYYVTKYLRQYAKDNNIEIYYHYHTRGLNRLKKLFIWSMLAKFLNKFNVILLSPRLKKEFESLPIKSFYFLPNGIENPFENEKKFNEYINKKFNKKNKRKILFLSNMIKSKGYFDVLKLAKKYKNYEFSFAGNWMNDSDKEEFFKYIKDNNLSNVKFYGFVKEKEKRKLFEENFLLIFPTKYINEAFPLILLEAFSYGLPVISTTVGSIPDIVDKDSGILVDEYNELEKNFELYFKKLVNLKTSEYCRNKYLNNFTLEKFEDNLIQILKG